jgi:hypothetical protein
MALLSQARSGAERYRRHKSVRIKMPRQEQYRQ